MAKAAPLKLSKFTKSYGRFNAVEDISVELKSGEVFGFLGPNGSGKSTTIRTIMNFMQPTSGSISIFGKDSAKDTVAVKHRMGYLAGDIALYSSMTGRQVLKHLTALGKDTDWAYVDHLTKLLDASLDKQIGSLSKGNKQKIGLIQAFMHKPDLLILDEPTSGLDPLMKQVFYDMVLELRKQGRSFFVSSHDLTEVNKICDRAAFIREGKLIAIENIKGKDGPSIHRYVISFKKIPPSKNFESIREVTEVQTRGKTMTVTITGHMDRFIKELGKHDVIEMDEQEITLESLFMHYYEKQGDQND